MPKRDIVVIGGSSGGIEALREALPAVAPSLSAAVFIVQHIASNSGDFLPAVLDRTAKISVHSAEDGLAFEPGHAYVAAADHHLLIDADEMFLSKGPRENRARPAIDVLFRSAALSCGSRVVLSGSLDDGTAGLEAIKQCRGVTVVQDPADAITPDMPRSALEYVASDHVVRAADLGPTLHHWSTVRIRTRPRETTRPARKWICYSAKWL